MSVAQPDTIETVGEFNEKARLAHRPMALSEWLVAQTARTLLADAAPGLWAVNTAPLPYTGWIPVPTAAFRRDYPGADHSEPGMQPWAFPKKPADLSPENDPAVFSDTVPDQVTKFWVERLPAHTATIIQPAAAVSAMPAIQVDAHGWPESVSWPGSTGPLFTRALGDFSSIRPTGFAPRSTLNAMAAGKPGTIETTVAAPLETTVRETGHTIVYTQAFTHPSLIRGKRRPGDLAYRAPRHPHRHHQPPLLRPPGELLPGLPPARWRNEPNCVRRRRAVCALSRPAPRLLHGLLRHRRLGPLRHPVR